MFGDDPPSPRAIFGRFLGLTAVGAAGALVLILVATGEFDWTLFAFLGLVWALWGFVRGVFGTLIEPAGRFLADQLTGNVPVPGDSETLDEETARFERLLDAPLTPHREILIGVRLAEIYRLHQHDAAKADALLARLRAKHPDATELI